MQSALFYSVICLVLVSNVLKAQNSNSTLNRKHLGEDSASVVDPSGSNIQKNETISGKSGELERLRSLFKAGQSDKPGNKSVSSGLKFKAALVAETSKNVEAALKSAKGPKEFSSASSKTIETEHGNAPSLPPPPPPTECGSPVASIRVLREVDRSCGSKGGDMSDGGSRYSELPWPIEACGGDDSVCPYELLQVRWTLTCDDMLPHCTTCDFVPPGAWLGVFENDSDAFPHPPTGGLEELFSSLRVVLWLRDYDFVTSVVHERGDFKGSHNRSSSSVAESVSSTSRGAVAVSEREGGAEIDQAELDIVGAGVGESAGADFDAVVANAIACYTNPLYCQSWISAWRLTAVEDGKGELEDVGEFELRVESSDVDGPSGAEHVFRESRADNPVAETGGDGKVVEGPENNAEADVQSDWTSGKEELASKQGEDGEKIQPRSGAVDHGVAQGKVEGEQEWAATPLSVPPYALRLKLRFGADTTRPEMRMGKIRAPREVTDAALALLSVAEKQLSLRGGDRPELAAHGSGSGPPLPSTAGAARDSNAAETIPTISFAELMAELMQNPPSPPSGTPGAPAMQLHVQAHALQYLVMAPALRQCLGLELVKSFGPSPSRSDKGFDPTDEAGSWLTREFARWLDARTLVLQGPPVCTVPLLIRRAFSSILAVVASHWGTVPLSTLRSLGAGLLVPRPLSLGEKRQLLRSEARAAATAAVKARTFDSGSSVAGPAVEASSAHGAVPPPETLASSPSLGQVANNLRQVIEALHSGRSDGRSGDGATPRRSISGTIALRLAQPGRFRLRLYLMEPESLGLPADVSTAQLRAFPVAAYSHSLKALSVRVCDACPREVTVFASSRPLVPPIGSAAGRPQGQAAPSVSAPILELPPSAVFHMRGVFGLSGARAMVVPNALLPMSIGPNGMAGPPGSGSWSLSFWLYVGENFTGKHRTLFYKGTGDEWRTPSAWLEPHSLRLALRVSAGNDPDAGVTSRSEVPLRNWAHVVFVARNRTSEMTTLREANGAVSRVFFTLSFWLNAGYGNGTEGAAAAALATPGGLGPDTELHTMVPARHNSGPIHFGKDPTFNGFKGFISDLRIFPRALENGEIKYLYESTKHAYSGGGLHGGSDNADDLRVLRGSQALSSVRGDLPDTSEVVSSSAGSLLTRDTSLPSSQKKSAAAMSAAAVVAATNSPQDSASRAVVTLTSASDWLNPLAPVPAAWSIPLRDSGGSLVDSFEAGGEYSAVGWMSEAEANELYTMAMGQLSEGCTRADSVLEQLEWAGLGGHAAALFHAAQMLLDGPSRGPIAVEACERSRAAARAAAATSAAAASPFVSTATGAAVFAVEGVVGAGDPEPFAEAALGIEGSATIFNNSTEISDSGGRLREEGRGEHSDRITSDSLPVIDSVGRGGSGETAAAAQEGMHFVARDVPRAVALLQRSARRGHGGAVAQLGVLWATASGVTMSSVASSASSATGVVSSAASAEVLAVGLYHGAAAASADPTAMLALGQRYFIGDGVPRDEETAAQYLLAAADVAYAAQHRTGAQPLLESKLISEHNVESVGQGERGESDEILQFTVLRAEQGDAAAQLALGDMYYWGARGFARDQAAARNLFAAAAAQGNVAGMNALASMLLKGEGGVSDVSGAIGWLEQVAEAGRGDHATARALNGLGYAYFYGNGVDKNLTQAFNYFRAAADLALDGDSLFNAGHCYAQGLGVAKNLTAAAEMYSIAALRFGHFDSIYWLGQMYMNGDGVPRSATIALRYLVPAARAGALGELPGIGFQRWLRGDADGAALAYMEAAELGYDVADRNLAYLLQAPASIASFGPLPVTSSVLNQSPLPGTTLSGALLALVAGPPDCGMDFSLGPDAPGALELGSAVPHFVGTQTEESSRAIEAAAEERLALHFAKRAAERGDAAAARRVGDGWYYGRGGLTPSSARALQWYSRASAAGDRQATYNVGFMYEHGLGVPANFARALRYYSRLLLSPSAATAAASGQEITGFEGKGSSDEKIHGGGIVGESEGLLSSLMHAVFGPWIWRLRGGFGGDAAAYAEAVAAAVGAQEVWDGVKPSGPPIGAGGDGASGVAPGEERFAAQIAIWRLRLRRWASIEAPTLLGVLKSWHVISDVPSFEDLIASSPATRASLPPVPTHVSDLQAPQWLTAFLRGDSLPGYWGEIAMTTLKNFSTSFTDMLGLIVDEVSQNGYSYSTSSGLSRALIRTGRWARSTVAATAGAATELLRSSRQATNAEFLQVGEGDGVGRKGALSSRNSQSQLIRDGSLQGYLYFWARCVRMRLWLQLRWLHRTFNDEDRFVVFVDKWWSVLISMTRMYTEKGDEFITFLKFVDHEDDVTDIEGWRDCANGVFALILILGCAGCVTALILLLLFCRLLRWYLKRHARRGSINIVGGSDSLSYSWEAQLNENSSSMPVADAVSGAAAADGDIIAFTSTENQQLPLESMGTDQERGQDGGGLPT